MADFMQQPCLLVEVSEGVRQPSVVAGPQLQLRVALACARRQDIIALEVPTSTSSMILPAVSKQQPWPAIAPVMLVG